MLQLQRTLPSARGHLSIVPRPGGSPDRPGLLAPPRLVTISLRELIRQGFPQRELCSEVNRWRLKNCRNLFRGLKPVMLAKAAHLPILLGTLHLTPIFAESRMVPYGLASLRVITDAGVAFLVNDWNDNSTDLTNFFYHGLGTGTTAEAAADTALVTELTTQLNPDNVRATGTKSKPAANQLRSVGTLTFDASVTVAEHGIFSSATVGAGTLWDRSVFTGLPFVSTDSLQTTHTTTVSSGG
jgi:hypothetical protein